MEPISSYYCLALCLSVATLLFSKSKFHVYGVVRTKFVCDLGIRDGRHCKSYAVQADCTAIDELLKFKNFELAIEYYRSATWLPGDRFWTMENCRSTTTTVVAGNHNCSRCGFNADIARTYPVGKRRIMGRTRLIRYESDAHLTVIDESHTLRNLELCI